MYLVMCSTHAQREHHYMPQCRSGEILEQERVPRDKSLISEKMTRIIMVTRARGAYLTPRLERLENKVGARASAHTQALAGDLSHSIYRPEPSDVYHPTQSRR